MLVCISNWSQNPDHNSKQADKKNIDIAGGVADVGMDIFERGLCLPSDINMTAEQQDIVIEIVKKCFE